MTPCIRRSTTRIGICRESAVDGRQGMAMTRRRKNKILKAATCQTAVAQFAEPETAVTCNAAGHVRNRWTQFRGQGIAGAAVEFGRDCCPLRRPFFIASQKALQRLATKD